MKQLIRLAHIVIIILAYSSPFWLSWQYVFLGVLVYWLQIIIFKACVLTIAEYKTTDVSFVGNYINSLLGHIGKHISSKHRKILLNIVLPILFVSLAYILQTSEIILPIVKWG